MIARREFITLVGGAAAGRSFCSFELADSLHRTPRHCRIS
jgi:hypothetical protein